MDWGGLAPTPAQRRPTKLRDSASLAWQGLCENHGEQGLNIILNKGNAPEGWLLRRTRVGVWVWWRLGVGLGGPGALRILEMRVLG